MQRDVILIFGQTGSGKTTKAGEIILTYPRVLILEAGFEEFDAARFRGYADLVRGLRDRGAFSSPVVPFRVAYTPLEYDYPDCFELARSVGPCLLVLEEADRFTENPAIPEYSELISRGRHYGISLCAVALHPFHIPKDIRRQCTECYCARTIEPDDLRYLAEIIGPRAYDVPAMPEYQFLEWKRSDLTAAKTREDLTTQPS